MEPQQSEYANVELSKLYPSPRNPRRTFSKDRLDELKKTIQKQGVITPLIVRSNGKAGKLEILAGERRYRAAKELGLKELPVRIRELDDSAALELMIVENLQRDDVHPMEEAEGYKSLLDEKGKDGKLIYDVPAIAAKVGKSTSYVYQRIKLTELIPEAQKLFLDNMISAAHAVIIARLQPVDQKEVIEHALWESHWESGQNVRRACSVRSLIQYVATHVHLDLSKAVFNTKDAALVPAAGACTTCPKRTGFIPELFPDIKKKDDCTDRNCYRSKVLAFIEQRREALRAKKIKFVEISTTWAMNPKPKGVLMRESYNAVGKKKKCESTILGLVTHAQNGDLGKDALICTAKKCKLHGNIITSYHSGGASDAAYKARQQKAEAQRRCETIARQRTLNLAIAKFAKFDEQDFRFLARRLFDEMQQDAQSALFKTRGWEKVKKKGQYGGSYYDMRKQFTEELRKLSALEVNRVLMQLALVPTTGIHTYSTPDAKPLLEFARRMKVKPVSGKTVAAEKRKREKKKVAKKAGKPALKKAA